VRKAVKLLNFSLASWLLAKVDSQILNPLFVGELIEEVFAEVSSFTSDWDRKLKIKDNKKKVSRMLKFLLELPVAASLPIPGRNVGEKISFLHDRRKLDFNLFSLIATDWWGRKEDESFWEKFTFFLDKGAYPIRTVFSQFLEIQSTIFLPELNYVLRRGPPPDRPWLRPDYKKVEHICRYCSRREFFDTILLIAPYRRP